MSVGGLDCVFPLLDMENYRRLELGISLFPYGRLEFPRVEFFLPPGTLGSNIISADYTMVK